MVSETFLLVSRLIAWLLILRIQNLLKQNVVRILLQLRLLFLLDWLIERVPPFPTVIAVWTLLWAFFNDIGILHRLIDIFLGDRLILLVKLVILEILLIVILVIRRPTVSILTLLPGFNAGAGTTSEFWRVFINLVFDIAILNRGSPRQQAVVSVVAAVQALLLYLEAMEAEVWRGLWLQGVPWVVLPERGVSEGEWDFGRGNTHFLI